MKEPDGKLVSNDRAQTSVRIMAGVLFGFGLAIAYWVWPSGITDSPLMQIKFGDLLRVGASVAITLTALTMATLLWID